MNYSVLFKDIGLAVFWLVLRALPYAGMIFLVIGTSSDAPWWLNVVLFVFVFAWMAFVATLCTNSVPTLLWRYNDKHETRLIQIKQHKYRQIKICGIWFYLVMLEGGKRCKLAYIRGWNDELLQETESRYTTMIDNTKVFQDNFETFVNAWRISEIFETLKYNMFEGGRRT